DDVVRQLHSRPHVVDEFIDLGSKFWVFVVGPSPAPAHVVQTAPEINEFENTRQAFVGKSVIHGETESCLAGARARSISPPGKVYAAASTDRSPDSRATASATCLRCRRQDRGRRSHRRRARA